MTHFLAEGKRTLHLASRAPAPMVGTPWNRAVCPSPCLPHSVHAAGRCTVKNGFLWIALWGRPALRGRSVDASFRLGRRSQAWEPGSPDCKRGCGCPFHICCIKLVRMPYCLAGSGFGKNETPRFRNPQIHVLRHLSSTSARHAAPRYAWLRATRAGRRTALAAPHMLWARRGRRQGGLGVCPRGRRQKAV
jgi:hypothetical protein